jgi:hypothetical protein
MAALAKDLGAPGADRAKVLDEYKALGGKLIAAMLESPVSDGAFSSGSTTTGLVRYTSARDGDVAALLATPNW